MPVAVLVLGLALVGGGVAWQRRSRRLARATGVSGTIVDYEDRFTGKSGASFPVVAFHTLNGKTMRVTMRQGRLFTYPRVGSQVKVIYDPAKPDVAYIDSAGFRYGSFAIVIVGLGLVVLSALRL
jgi:Protein of unknown function (DUF3592)